MKRRETFCSFLCASISNFEFIGRQVAFEESRKGLMMRGSEWKKQVKNDGKRKRQNEKSFDERVAYSGSWNV